MFGPGYGFGVAGGTRRHRGGTPTPSPSATGTLTLSAVPSYEDKRIYQRATRTGGGQGKGSGAISLAISGALAGTINARILSDDLTTVLQTLPDMSIANGQTMITVPGIDARYGWFHVELRDSSGVWQRQSYKCGMGALFGAAGQSLMVRMLGRQDGQTATYASLGITPDPCSAALVYYSEGNSYTAAAATQPWITPGDVGNGNGPNSAGVGELLNRLIALTGVNCGLVGAAVGGTEIKEWISGGTYATQLTSRLSRAGGAFEGFFWGQGHGNSKAGLPAKAYAGGLTQLFAMITAANSVSGYGKYVWTIPTTRNGSWGTPYTYNLIRKGADDWCTANGGYHVHAHDIAQIDAIHESQAGAVTLARAMYRAARAYYAGNSSHLGPKILAATRSGTRITAALSDVGQGTINLVGTAGNRLFVFPRGRVDRAALDNNRFPVTVSVSNRLELFIDLANDPGDGHDLDLYVYWPNGPANAMTDNLYDDRTDGDGITLGRFLQANHVPVQIASPSPGGTVNAPPGGFVAAVSPLNMAETGTSYGASYDAAFGNEMTGGRALAGASKTPRFYPVTAEGWFTCPTIPASVQVLFGDFGNGHYIGITSAGKITTDYDVGTTTLVAGCRYHVAAQFGPSGRSIYLTKLTDAVGAPITPVITREKFVAGAMTMAPTAGAMGLRTLLGSFNLSGGAVDEWALFISERYSGASYTCPTAPFTGAEADIVALFHCNNDGKEALAA